MPASKKDMSIDNLINPPSTSIVAGKKRKAGDVFDEEAEATPGVVRDSFSFDEISVGAMPEATPTEAAEAEESIQPVSRTDAIASPEKPLLTAPQSAPARVASTKAPAVATDNPRPAKRLRTALTHIALFTAGAVTTLAGLASLPDHFFEN